VRVTCTDPEKKAAGDGDLGMFEALLKDNLAWFSANTILARRKHWAAPNSHKDVVASRLGRGQCQEKGVNCASTGTSTCHPTAELLDS